VLNPRGRPSLWRPFLLSPKGEKRPSRRKVSPVCRGREGDERQAWATRFSYFCGTDGNSFRVDFNQQGKRVNSTAMVGPPSRRIRNPSAPGRIRRITGRLPPSSLISPIHRARKAARLSPGFVNNVERGLACAPETTETRLGYHSSDAGFSGLRAQTQSYFLRS
jgi:hypothetical protein